MSNELRDKIEDVVYETLNIWEPLGKDDESSFLAQAIIDFLGLTETDASRHNEMVKYETKWLPRSQDD